jgi:hypothetical protein
LVRKKQQQEEAMKRQMSEKLSRRELLKLSGGLAACSSAAAAQVPTSVSRTAATPTESKGSSELFKVVRPTGDVTVQPITQAPRLDTLNDKTVCMVINGSFKSWVTAPVIEDLLKKKYRTIKVIPFSKMPRSQKAPARGTTTPETDALIAALKQNGCQALVSGNGG